MAISVMADLAGCKVAFLVLTVDKRTNGLPMKAMQKLLSMGIKHVKTLTLEEASAQYAKTQQRHKYIPAEQRFLKLTPKGNIVKLFV